MQGFVYFQGQTNKSKGFGAPKPLQRDGVRAESQSEPSSAHPKTYVLVQEARMGIVTI